MQRAFATELERHRYTAGTAEKQVALAAHLNRWLAAAGTGPGDLTERYASARRAAGYAGYKPAHAVEPLPGYLRGLGAVPAAEPQPVTPAQALLERFQRYLVSERGIGSATAESYVCFVRRCAGRHRGRRHVHLGRRGRDLAHGHHPRRDPAPRGRRRRLVPPPHALTRVDR